MVGSPVKWTSSPRAPCFKLILADLLTQPHHARLGNLSLQWRDRDVAEGRQPTDFVFAYIQRNTKLGAGTLLNLGGTGRLVLEVGRCVI